MKQHDFKVGDKIERFDSGVSCTVERIDPSCNNVYGKDFSNHRRDGEEIIYPSQWKVVKPAAPAAATTARDFIDNYDKFEVTILRDTTGGDPFASTGFGAQFVHRATVDKRNEGLSYPAQVRAYLEEVRPTLTTPGSYVAIAVYGDNDTICVKFSTEKIEQPIAVKFDLSIA